jgi:hypothetical protein
MAEWPRLVNFISYNSIFKIVDWPNDGTVRLSDGTVTLLLTQSSEAQERRPMFRHPIVTQRLSSSE